MIGLIVLSKDANKKKKYTNTASISHTNECVDNIGVYSDVNTTRPHNNYCDLTFKLDSSDNIFKMATISAILNIRAAQFLFNFNYTMECICVKNVHKNAPSSLGGIANIILW